MVLPAPGRELEPAELRDPAAGPGQLHLTVRACAVCRTDLHLRDAEIEATKLPIVLGHQIVGESEDGRRFGVPWLGWTCGECVYCRSGRENLCPRARFTGRDIDGGYAEQTVADARFCFPLPDGLPDEQAAPLLCGGLIGYRALTLAGDGERLGLYGFGSAAHMIAQVAVHQGREVYAFTRPGDERTQSFARSLGARLGRRQRRAPARAAARGDHLRVGRRARPGGAAGARARRYRRLRRDPHERHPGLPLRRPVDGALGPQRGQPHPPRRRGIPGPGRRHPIRTTVTTYPLEQAEEALADLRAGAFEGSAVLVPWAPR